MNAVPDKPLWVVRASERRRYAFEKSRDPGDFAKSGKSGRHDSRAHAGDMNARI